jgi:ATPase subunit of ABC transporter with duplicated ATPase domains
LDAQTLETLTGALQDFGGAIVAITHNQAFARNLNATHILRVQARHADAQLLQATCVDWS